MLSELRKKHHQSTQKKTPSELISFGTGLLSNLVKKTWQQTHSTLDIHWLFTTYNIHTVSSGKGGKEVQLAGVVLACVFPRRMDWDFYKCLNWQTQKSIEVYRAQNVERSPHTQRETPTHTQTKKYYNGRESNWLLYELAWLASSTCRQGKKEIGRKYEKKGQKKAHKAGGKWLKRRRRRRMRIEREAVSVLPVLHEWRRRQERNETLSGLLLLFHD